MMMPVQAPPSPKTLAHMEYLRRLEEANKHKKHKPRTKKQKTAAAPATSS